VEYWTGVLSYFNLAGAIHALGQAALLWSVRRGRRHANRIMAAFLGVLAVGMCHGVALRLGVYERWPWFALLMATLPLLYGPLFFFYVRAITSPGTAWRKGDALHVAPFLLGLGVYLVSQTAAWTQAARLVRAVPLMPWHVVFLLATTQTVAYLRRIRGMLRRHEEAVRDSCSTVDRVTLGWLRWRVLAYGVIWAAGIVGMAAFAFTPAALGLVSQIVFFLVAVNSFLTGYRAMLQPVFFGPGEPQRHVARYERSSLTPEDAERHEARLLALMERERCFLDPDLTLPALAQALGIQPAHLSRIINERLGKNFFEFVNGYRVEAARQRLARPGSAGEKLIAVALESGFNSLATFNRVFKDLTGRTPSEYRRHPDSGPRESAVSR
jgi:AraC-like DNA-binding protein